MPYSRADILDFLYRVNEIILLSKRKKQKTLAQTIKMQEAKKVSKLNEKIDYSLMNS